MSNQYFENNEELTSNPQHITYYIYSETLTFKTDNGVFSKNSVDFGSSLLIKSFPKISENKKILDVGCGYGPIGLSLAKVNKNTIIDMVDVNKRAIDLAKENALSNNINNVNVYESNIYENVKDKFDYIISNPPIRAGKKVVFEILEKSYNYLNKDGELYIVIQKKQGAPSAIKLLKECYNEVDIINKDKGYFIIKCIKND